MATVYLAHDQRFRRDVAVKVLPHQFTHDSRFLERFNHGAQTIAALEHPAIVPVHDFGEHEDALYLVMRYMQGGSLRRRLAGRPVPLDEIGRILARLAPALDKAHLRGIIHRDLKPDNVLFDEDDLSYLADFGIARLAEATHTMTIVGTPAYMSPEQVRGDQKLDSRSDIYTLGVMLFEMLSGQPPYVADTLTKQMMAHVLEPVPQIQTINAALPARCQVVVERVMAKNRDERYGTAAEVSYAVQELLQPAALPPASAAETIVEPSPPPIPTPQTGLTRLEPLPARAVAQPTPAAAGSTPNRPQPRRIVAPWMWWVGAIGLLGFLIWGLSGLFGGDGNNEPLAQPTTQMALAVAQMATSTPTLQLVDTPTSQPTNVPTHQPTNTPRPSVSPTPTNTATSTPSIDPTIKRILFDTTHREWGVIYGHDDRNVVESFGYRIDMITPPPYESIDVVSAYAERNETVNFSFSTSNKDSILAFWLLAGPGNVDLSDV